ncbi:MAG: hypothetical protein CVU39_10935 [Chloroflexi bacterium HGW-Chloroflexi-10]|nr:MAG: hypothetical protein CVU39_10935 [Chloroflexi bacterium HGW-Chloroflexi-10]
MGKVDFHSHTDVSKDSLNRVEDVIRKARQAGLSKLVITDHNSIQGALRAQQLAPELIIVGEEILTSKGEILAAFVKEQIPRGLAPLEVIRRLKAQDAFISVSHPFDRFRSGWDLADLNEIVPLVDAIEIFNARSFTKNINDLAQAYAQKHNLPGTVGSDAHTLIEIGRVALDLPPFNTAAELRAVIRQGQVVSRYSSPLVRLGSTYARLLKQLGLRK